MTFDENGDEFSQWLLKNGYPELCALSEAVKGSKNAYRWLIDNKFYHLAAFDSVLDKSKDARLWLIKFKREYLQR